MYISLRLRSWSIQHSMRGAFVRGDASGGGGGGGIAESTLAKLTHAHILAPPATAHCCRIPRRAVRARSCAWRNESDDYILTASIHGRLHSTQHARRVRVRRWRWSLVTRIRVRPFPATSSARAIRRRRRRQRSIPVNTPIRRRGRGSRRAVNGGRHRRCLRLRLCWSERMLLCYLRHRHTTH